MACWGVVQRGWLPKTRPPIATVSEIWFQKPEEDSWGDSKVKLKGGPKAILKMAQNFE